MRMKLCAFGLLLSLVMVPYARADLIEEDPQYTDNTGALGTGTNEADISAEVEEEIAGTAKGEITLYKNDAGVMVYSGLNKVESIPTGSDGWVGSLTFQSSAITFQPSGRPALDCPSQDITGWYGPCKMAEQGQ